MYILFNNNELCLKEVPRSALDGRFAGFGTSGHEKFPGPDINLVARRSIPRYGAPGKWGFGDCKM